jgi:hypothetical protein
MAAKSKSAKYYAENPKARKKKQAYDKKNNAKPEAKAKRAELGRKRYADKKKGKDIDGKDYDHKQGKYMSPSKNRGQAEKSRLKGSKRKK